MAKRILSFMATVFFVFCFQTPGFTQSLPVFGPNKYVRTTGAPNTYTASFQSCNTGATYKLVVENGEGDKNRISSAFITLNGQEIVKQNDFSQKIDKIEKAATLQQENTLEIKLASGPGGFIKISVYCVSNCLEVKIASPASGTNVNKSQTIIKGDLYNAFGETEVVLQSSGPGGKASALAQTRGANFAGVIPLQQGQNTITATATDACGYKTTDTIIVNTETLEEKISLTANPSSGIPPLSVTLEAEAYPPNPVSSYSWDTNGDGTPDQTGSTLSKITVSYQNPGLYFPKVTITDTKNNTYSETTIVNVLSKEEIDVILKGKWDGMKGKLSHEKITDALNYFAKDSKMEYREIFELLSPKLSSLVSGMSEITMMGVRENVAEYYIKRFQRGTDISYFIYFIKDEDGIWKIRDF